MKSADFVVVYDITDNRERRRLSKLLKGYGRRVQKSVFECRLNKSSKKQMIQELEGLEIETGFAKIYRLEYSFNKTVIGNSDEDNLDSGAAFVI